MNGKVNRLATGVSGYIRASSSISTYHTALEEVILNSIDAGSRNIEIVLNFDTISFQVSDDGKSILHTELKETSE